MRHSFSTISLLIIVLFARCQKEEEIAQVRFAGMKVTNYQEHYHVGFWGEENNMEISLFACGVNQLFAIGRIRYYSSLNDHFRGITLNDYLSSTDWIGPYFVCGEENIQAGLPQKFTGGWHGSNGDGTGDRTAYTKEIVILADGVQTEIVDEVSCKRVEFIVTNYIHGYDYSLSGKNLLKETVHYTITEDRKIDVQLQIEALNDLRIQRYYGLQSQNFAIFDSVKYIAGEQQISTAIIAANTKCQSNEGVNTILLVDQSLSHQLKLVLNTNEGIGNFNYLAEGLPRAFSASYRKSYFNLVNGKELVMKKGEKVFWNGSYVWD